MVPADAVQLDGDAAIRVCEINLGNQSPVAAAYSILKPGTVESGVDEKVLHHAAPSAERHRVVPETGVESGPQCGTAGASPARVSDEHAAEVGELELSVPQHGIDRAIESLTVQHRCQIQDRPLQTSARNALSANGPRPIQLCRLVHGHTFNRQAPAGGNEHLDAIEPKPVDACSAAADRWLATASCAKQTESRRDSGVGDTAACRYTPRAARTQRPVRRRRSSWPLVMPSASACARVVSPCCRFIRLRTRSSPTSASDPARPSNSGARLGRAPIGLSQTILINIVNTLYS